MKKAWRIEAQYGSTFIVLFSESGKIIDYYRESTCTGMVKPRAFSFSEYDKGIPQNIMRRLNKGLCSIGEYTNFIAN